ncbi:aminopeptidase O isoform X2 [Gouania willdenowi]|uniref:Peptidase M1 leukotriene A4 hydrolase/aminopeptidase C-terminal domain-containing protein n=1 Tax=Gouania willdenowi TaxID=441366 RepID=A0A8C5N5W4_GOUWI|nr:aminopeptidase O isoform X2 [Gouania willdenowi]
MELKEDLNPSDDLPLRSNTNHILVRHYVLDLDVHFDSRIISGSITLFLEPVETSGSTGISTIQTSGQTSPDGDFTLVLDCCDLTVSKVEELDVTSVLSSLDVLPDVSSRSSADVPLTRQTDLIRDLISMSCSQWRHKHQLLSLCSGAPGVQDGSSMRFNTDRWSLQVWKDGVTFPQQFPRALRICYETKPGGGSVRWTRDQDNRECVYTAGSPINNRALFPCQEPPVAMSTWQATVRAPSGCVVLMSGEEEALPTQDQDTSMFSVWRYYVTMAMPASTFTLAVGHWRQVTEEVSLTGERCEDRTVCGKAAAVAGEDVKDHPIQTDRSDSAFCCSSPEDKVLSAIDYSGVDGSISCCHGDYPCRFTMQSAWSQRVIPHRVFSCDCLLHKAQMQVLPLLSRCLAAAHDVLGVHPFPRLDVLIVPSGFSSLGMASPHIIFLSQSVLSSGENSRSLCGSRICHEIAHSWFGLVIGARDWTEEWISEGFATCLEDIIWARAQQLSVQETAEQFELKALLRWRRLSDELQNSKEELQILRPNMEKTGEVRDSGSSTVKHALNPDKSFMQVHYLKGFFLLRFLSSHVGEQRFIEFFRLFVKTFHGQLILSQDFLQMLLVTFPDLERNGFTLTAIYADWLDRPGIPEWLYERSSVWSQAKLVEEVRAELTSEQLVMLLELLLEEEELSRGSLRALHTTYRLQTQDAEVQHRWCELVVKHAYAQAYRDVEEFLIHHQAMGVYLYGELMVQEKPTQQALARRCLSLVQEEMDQSARRVVEEMVL